MSAKKYPPDNATDKVTRLAKRGVKESDIAKGFGVSPKTFRRWKNENDEIKEALITARQIEEDALVGILYEKAMDGDRTSAIFLLKARHGYREGVAAIKADNMNVQINLPGAQNPDDYTKQLKKYEKTED